MYRLYSMRYKVALIVMVGVIAVGAVIVLLKHEAEGIAYRNVARTCLRYAHNETDMYSPEDELFHICLMKEVNRGHITYREFKAHE